MNTGALVDLHRGGSRERTHRHQAILACAICAYAPLARGDGLLHRYDGDVLPYDPSAGWILVDACEAPCSESFGAGHFVLRWAQGVDQTTFAYRIAPPDVPPPPSLWFEWRFRSDHPLAAAPFFGCDAIVIVRYVGMVELVDMFGDAASNIEGSQFVTGLQIDEFHSYRFESLDGHSYRIAVDGRTFVESTDDHPSLGPTVQVGGQGGCVSTRPPVVTNEWDFVRLGTIGFGEQIIATDPRAGVLDPLAYPNLDRFLVTYDSPNYAYIDDITVEVLFGSDEATKRGTAEDGFRHKGTRARRHEAGAGDAQAEAREQGIGSGEQRAPVSRGLAPAWAGAGGDEAPRRQVDPAAVPQVIATRRRDNGNPEDLEVVLDRPMPIGATTRFTFNDGVTQNVVEYTLGIPGLCCLIGGGCAAAFDPTCTNGGGAFVPDGACTTPQPCCLPTRQCQILDPLCCTANNGTVLNSPDPCEGDADDDGTDALCGDGCPNDPAKLDPGVCGCGVSDTADADGDSVPDCTDQCPGADDAVFAPGCAVAIPAASQWGIMILALALGVAAKVRFGRSRAAAPRRLRDGP